MKFVDRWTEMEQIKQSEVTQSEKDKHMHLSYTGHRIEILICGFDLKYTWKDRNRKQQLVCAPKKNRIIEWGKTNGERGNVEYGKT